MRQEHSDTIYGIVPEYEHHEVRYAAFSAKLPKNSKLPIKEPPIDSTFKHNDVLAIFDREDDDDDETLNLSRYFDPDLQKLDQEEKKKKLKKTEIESLDSVYETLRAMNINTIKKIILKSKKQLIEAEKKPPTKVRLEVISQLFKTMFNPDQKLAIYMSVREALNVPPHEFRKVQHIYTILSPEAALLIFQKKFKIDTKNNALGILAGLELLYPSFYEKKSMSDLHCRT